MDSIARPSISPDMVSDGKSPALPVPADSAYRFYFLYL